MTLREWVLKEYGIKLTKFEMPLPTMVKGYFEYCEENDVEPVLD